MLHALNIPRTPAIIAPVDAIKTVDVRIEEDIIGGYRRRRRQTVQRIWTLLSSYVMIQTDGDSDFQPLHDGYLQNFGARKAPSHGVCTPGRRSSRQASLEAPLTPCIS